MPRLGERGISMIEVLVAAGSVALIVYSFMSVQDLRSQLLGRVHFSYLLSEVVVANLAEVKTKKRELLPQVDKCLVRFYGVQKSDFLREVVVGIGEDGCGKSALAPGEMEVIWKVSRASDSNPVFNPSAFLKLPTHVASVLQIEVRGRLLSPPPGPKEQTFGTVIFRR